jgi:hypothetical protein
MKERSYGFLRNEIISHDSEQFDYISELHEYLWRFIRSIEPGASGKISNYLDRAVEKLEGSGAPAQSSPASGEPSQPVTGPMRFDLMLEKIDGENAQNSEVFNDMRAHIWAAGASHEDADFITRMLTRKGLYIFQTEPWKRCPSTHCERRGECSGPRDCTVKCPSPSVSSTNNQAAED